MSADTWRALGRVGIVIAIAGLVVGLGGRATGSPAIAAAVGVVIIAAGTALTYFARRKAGIYPDRRERP